MGSCSPPYPPDCSCAAFNTRDRNSGSILSNSACAFITGHPVALRYANRSAVEKGASFVVIAVRLANNSYSNDCSRQSTADDRNGSVYDGVALRTSGACCQAFLSAASACQRRRGHSDNSARQRIVPVLLRMQQGQVERFHELGDLDRLGQVAEKPGFHAARDVARHSVGRQRQHWDM